MSKKKRKVIDKPNNRPKPVKKRPPKAIRDASAKFHSATPKKPLQPSSANHDHQLPFSPTDRILLVGEADLSFTLSLLTTHACTSLTATVYEPSRAALIEKYPHASTTISTIESEYQDCCKIIYGVDVTSHKPFTTKAPTLATLSSSTTTTTTTTITATKKEKTGVFTKIIFNFPHTGGLSTDVNRQVRHNQQLLVSFFQRFALPSLAPIPGASIIVTLFEGEPYTLWNVRDLARHAGGLRLGRSMRFQWGVYRGYGHARTLGVVGRRKDGGDEGEGEGEGEDVKEQGGDEDEFAARGTGVHGKIQQDESDDKDAATKIEKSRTKGPWRGEDRPARSYVFVRADDPSDGMPTYTGPQSGKKRIRKGATGSHDDSDHDESD